MKSEGVTKRIIITKYYISIVVVSTKVRYIVKSRVWTELDAVMLMTVDSISPRTMTAVDTQLGARHVTTSITKQVQHRATELVSPAQAVEHTIPFPLLLHARPCECVNGGRCADVAWREGVYPDHGHVLARTPFSGQGTSELKDS